MICFRSFRTFRVFRVFHGLIYRFYTFLDFTFSTPFPRTFSGFPRPNAHFFTGPDGDGIATNPSVRVFFVFFHVFPCVVDLNVTLHEKRHFAQLVRKL